TKKHYGYKEFKDTEYQACHIPSENLAVGLKLLHWKIQNMHVSLIGSFAHKSTYHNFHFTFHYHHLPIHNYLLCVYFNSVIFFYDGGNKEDVSLQGQI
ncbi:hypothetical protein ACJX0J_035541, partial [Zea mays]